MKGMLQHGRKARVSSLPGGKVRFSRFRRALNAASHILGKADRSDADQQMQRSYYPMRAGRQQAKLHHSKDHYDDSPEDQESRGSLAAAASHRAHSQSYQ